MHQRLVYIDCLRGLAIFMVVYCHVLTFSLGVIDPSPIGLWMRDIMLPLFFFISGFCAFKNNLSCTPRDMCMQLKDKVFRILVPTVVMFLAFTTISGNDALVFAFHYDKCGYWFTWVLFQIIVIYLLFRQLSYLTNKLWLRIVILLTPFAIMQVLFQHIGFDSNAAILFEWVKVKMYYLYFMSGIFVRWFAPTINSLLHNSYVNLIVFLIAIFSYANLNGKYGICRDISLITNILTLYYVFMTSERKLSRPTNLFACQLSTIGRNTLPIYFLHFYLLFRIPMISTYLESLKTDMCFGTNSCSSIVEF